MNRSIAKRSLLAMTLAWFSVSPALAEENTSPLSAELSYLAESVRNYSGGLQKGTKNQATGTAAISIDVEKAVGWPGASAYVEFIVNHGREPNTTLLGDAQGASNIADGNRNRLQQAWFQQNLMDDAISLLVGTHDLNSEFYVSEYAGFFTNSSFGIGPEIGGNAGTSLWPEAGLAARVALQFNEQISLRVAGYDGDPATRALDGGVEGYMYIAELAYVDGDAAYKVGGWKHTKAATANAGQGLSGGYLIVDQPVMDWDGGNLGAFLQVGVAQRAAESFKNYIGVGVHVAGLIPGRADDEFGIAMARADFSDTYLTANAGFSKNETVFEVSYRAQLTDWLAIQPAFQFIKSPSGNTGLQDAKVSLLRVEISM